MEFWPVDFSPDASTSTKEKFKGKEVYRLSGHSIEPGTLGAATLILGQTPPTWITAVQPNSRHFPRQVGRPVEVFPPTKPPPIRVPNLTIHQRAEQGARFLRTYHPDVDISFELIRDELQLDEKETAANSVLDPYAGNRLVHLSMETKRRQLMPCLAFACGVTSSELNVSAFRSSKDKRFVFSPSAMPVMAFNTPIQQIVSFTPKEATMQKDALLAVRTHSVVSIVKLHSSDGVDIGVHPPIVAKTVLPISVSETGKRRIVDMSCGSLSSFNDQVLLVSDKGAMYNYRFLDGGKAVSPLSIVPADEDEEFGHDRFWRLAWSGSHACIRISSKKAHVFDLRTQNMQPEELFCLADSREYLTSLESPSGGCHTICFSTTNRILWYDERNSKRPILALKHQRAFDRSLRVESIPVGQSTLTTLSSAANHLVTVYDVNYASSGHLEVHGVPSLLPGPSEVDLPVLGSVCFQPPNAESSHYYHFQLSSRGSLWKTVISFPSEDGQQTSDNVPKDFEWSNEMYELAKKGKAMTDDIGNLGKREYIVANLRGIYEKIYDVQPNVSQVAEEDAEAVYQTLDKLPFFWQDMNGATEHMFTAFDVAFQCGPEPPQVDQADFLTESVLSSNRGYVALIGGRIPIPRLVSTVSWYYDMSSLPPEMVPDMSISSKTLFNLLQDEAMAQAMTPQGLQRATKAAQRLVLDLALSRHVFAPQFHPKTSIHVNSELDSADMLSRATKALSLGATKSLPLHFGFLHPIAKVPPEDDEHMNHEENLEDDLTQHIPLGVRLLLSQWDTGSSPEDYVYNDPHGVQDVPPTPTHAIRRKGTHNMTGLVQQVSIPTVVTAPRPPIVVLSTSRQKLLSRSRPPAQAATSERHTILESSPARQPQWSYIGDGTSLIETHGGSQDPTSSSHDILGPSTQPLPGPFGGGSRQLGTKKRSGKKRIGGF